MISANHARAVRRRSGAAHWLVLGLSALAACTVQAPRAEPFQPSMSVGVYALSRGKGVPEPTRKALRDAITLLEDLKRSKRVVRIEQSRIGLEGETRLCAEFKDAEAALEAIRQLRELARGVELFNVIEEPCRARE